MNMTLNLETILAVTGVIATIVIGYLGVKYTLKYRKNTSIIFLKNSSISLFKSVVKNLDELEINFKGKKIEENLIIFKGTFFNNGNVDIDNSIIHTPLEITLPKNFSWVNQKIIGSSKGLNANIEKRENKLIIQWDLLKEGEYIVFESLVEYKSDEGNDGKTGNLTSKLLKEITFDHRITNLKKIKKEGSIPRPMGAGPLTFLILLMLFLILPGFYVSIGQFFFPKYQVLNEVILDSKTEFVETKANDKNEVVLVNSSGDELKTMTLEEYQITKGDSSIIQKEDINYWILIFVGLISTFYLVAFIVFITNEIRERKLYKKIKSVADKHDDLELRERREFALKLFEFRVK